MNTHIWHEHILWASTHLWLLLSSPYMALCRVTMEQ